MGFVIEAGFFFCTVRRNDFASRSSFNFLAEQGPRNVHGKANAARQDVIRDALPPTPIPPANRPTNPSAPQRNRTRGQISPPFLRPRIYRRRNTCTDIEPIEDVPRVDFRWNRDEIETFSKNLRKEFDSGGRKNLHRKLKMFKTKIFYREFNLLFLPKILTRISSPVKNFETVKYIGSSLILLTESFKRKKETRIDKKK